MALIEKDGKILDFIETTGELVDPISQEPVASKIKEEPKKEIVEEEVNEEKEEKKFNRK